MAEPATLVEVPVRCLPLEVMPYLYPSRYCESDRLLKLAWTEFGALWPGYSRGLAIQNWVRVDGKGVERPGFRASLPSAGGLVHDRSHTVEGRFRLHEIRRPSGAAADHPPNPQMKAALTSFEVFPRRAGSHAQCQEGEQPSIKLSGRLSPSPMSLQPVRL